MRPGPGRGRSPAARGRVLPLVVLVVLAGCSGPLGAVEERTDEGTLTPAPVPETDGAADEFAPGVTDDGVIDAARLAAAHDRALVNVSYILRRNVTRRAADGTLRSGTEGVLRVAATRDRFRYTLVLRRGNRRVVDRYADGRRVYEHELGPNGTTYGLVRGPDGAPLAPRNASFGAVTNSRGIADLFARFRLAVTDRVERNGTTYYRLETPEPQTVPPIEDVTVTALVSERGLVRRYDVSYRIVDGAADENGGTRVEARVRISDVGSTTVREPAWYDEARDAVAVNATGASPTG